MPMCPSVRGAPQIEFAAQTNTLNIDSQTQTEKTLTMSFVRFTGTYHAHTQTHTGSHILRRLLASRSLYVDYDRALSAAAASAAKIRLVIASVVLRHSQGAVVAFHSLMNLRKYSLIFTVLAKQKPEKLLIQTDNYQNPNQSLADF